MKQFTDTRVTIIFIKVVSYIKELGRVIMQTAKKKSWFQIKMYNNISLRGCAEWNGITQTTS